MTRIGFKIGGLYHGTDLYNCCPLAGISRHLPPALEQPEESMLAENELSEEG
jgi:hypothetical protein